MSAELSQMQTDDENQMRSTRLKDESSNHTSHHHHAKQQRITRARTALTDLNNNTSTSAANNANNTTKATTTARSSLPPASNNNILPPGQKPIKIRADTQEEDVQNHHNGNNNIATAATTISTERTQLQIQDENRRMSLKRQAGDSSNDFLLAESVQETKKPRVDYTWDDLDADDFDDPLMVSEYVNDIFEYLHELELKTLPDSNYLHWQRNLRPKMRSILVDWMVEVHLKFGLLPETLYLSINLMDRFMSKESVQVDRLQLLATGALFIAAKYEEVFSPSVKNYAYVTDGGFTEDEILSAEKFILETLSFDMSYPNPMNFLRRISKADDYDVQSRTIGKYLLEITIIDHKFIGYLPSLCAAASMYIARKMLGKFDWNGNLIHYSGDYKESDLKEVCEMIMDYLVGEIVHEEFFRKYASKKFMKVAILARQWAKKITLNGKSIMDSQL